MAVINIRKDGTVIEDMSKVTVPEEIVKNIAKICEGRKQDGTRKGSNPRRITRTT